MTYAKILFLLNLLHLIYLVFFQLDPINLYHLLPYYLCGKYYVSQIIYMEFILIHMIELMSILLFLHPLLILVIFLYSIPRLFYKHYYSISYIIYHLIHTNTYILYCTHFSLKFGLISTYMISWTKLLF